MLATMIITRKAADEEGWAIEDPVVQLRLRGGAHGFALPPAVEGTQLMIGAAETCQIVLHDPSGRVSRQHAVLARGRHAWTVHDHDSTNGIWQDGERRLSIELAPAVELEVGGVALVAESTRLIALRGYLARIIGWDPARGGEVDQGIQAVRAMATRRAALVLCGDGDLQGVARQFHQLAVGTDRPFTMCHRDHMLPLPAAIAGTFCFADDTLPENFAHIAATLTASGAKARLIVCSPSQEDATEALTQLGRSVVLELPALATRPAELEQLIVAYADDTAQALGFASNGFREHEMVWLRKLEPTSLAEVQDLAYRLVILRNRHVSGGAELLGISHVALSRWAKRRGIPT
jgi:hypothetical protein